MLRKNQQEKPSPSEPLNIICMYEFFSPLKPCPCRILVQGCHRYTLSPRQSRGTEHPPHSRTQKGSSGPPGRQTHRRWEEAAPTLCSPSGSLEPGCQQRLYRRLWAPERGDSQLLRKHSGIIISWKCYSLSGHYSINGPCVRYSTFPKKRTKSPTVLMVATRSAFSTRMRKASRAEVQKLVLLMAVAV